jgi:DNA-binding IclR family transcriptional regulator
VTVPVQTGRAERTTGTPLNQSIDRAAALLGFFTPQRPELSLSELTARLGTSKATAHRYALALRRAGLLRYEPGRQVYALGPRIVELAASALAGLRIVKVAGPHMERLVARINETVVLSIWDGLAPVVVRVDDNTDRIARIVVATGTRLPADSAQGKVFTAFGMQGARQALGRDELGRIRASRVAVNSRVVQGIRAVATPVFQETELVAAMAVVGTTASVPEDSGSPVADALREAADVLSAELGFLNNERSG